MCSHRSRKKFRLSCFKAFLKNSSAECFTKFGVFFIFNSNDWKVADTMSKPREDSFLRAELVGKVNQIFL